MAHKAIHQLIFLIFFVCSALSSRASDASICAKVFQTKSDSVGNAITLDFIDYLHALHATLNSLSLEDLAKFRDNIENGDIANPIKPTRAQTDQSARHIYARQLDTYVSDPDIQWNLVVDWINEYLRTQSDHQTQRSEVAVDARPNFRRLEFALVPHGSYIQNIVTKRRFLSWKTETPVMAHLTNDFLVSTTPITQAQWVEVMGENPSQHTEGQFTEEIRISGQIIRLQPDNPVENVTWWSVLVYLNRLSEMHGLKPAYDLDHIEFWASRHIGYGFGGEHDIPRTMYRDNPNLAFNLAAKGVLTPTGHKTIAQEPKITSIDGSIYRAQGYRLLTSYEYEFLLSQRGKHQGNFSLKLDSDQILDHAWLHENTNLSTMPVAMRRGLAINGSDFVFDLIGNVSEFCQNLHVNLTGHETDPIGPADSIKHLLVGDLYYLNSTISCYGYNGSVKLGSALVEDSPRYPSKFTGFRIARTVNRHQEKRSE